MDRKIPNFASVWEGIKNYLNTRLELFKLIALKKASKLMADVITNTLVAFCLLMAFLASAVTLAFYLSQLLNSYTKGFGCAAIFFTILPFLLLWKKAAIERFIAGIAVRRYFVKHYEEQLEEPICNEPVNPVK